MSKLWRFVLIVAAVLFLVRLVAPSRHVEESVPPKPTAKEIGSFEEGSSTRHFVLVSDSLAKLPNHQELFKQAAKDAIPALESGHHLVWFVDTDKFTQPHSDKTWNDGARKAVVSGWLYNPSIGLDDYTDNWFALR